MDAAEDDLPKAPGDEPARPGQDHVSSGAPARTAHRGNDANRAAQAAAVLGLEQGPGAEGLFRRTLPGSKPGENTGRKLHLGGVRKQERCRGRSSSSGIPPSSNSSAQEKASAWFTRQPKF